MANKVYPVGYSAGGSQERVEQLMSDPKVLLIDCRKSPKSWHVYWQQDALKAKYKDQYKFAGDYLGNVHFYDHSLPIQLVDARTGIHGLCTYLREGHDIILLCQCVSFESCHRKVIVERLLEVRPSVEVIQPPKPEPVKVEQVTLFEVPVKREWHDI